MLTSCFCYLLIFTFIVAGNPTPVDLTPVTTTSVITTVANVLSKTTSTVIQEENEIDYVYIPYTYVTENVFDYTGMFLSSSTISQEDNANPTRTIEYFYPHIDAATITSQACLPGTYLNKEDYGTGLLLFTDLNRQQNDETSVRTLADMSYYFTDVNILTRADGLVTTLIGYFAPKEAGWYEFRTFNHGSRAFIEMLGNLNVMYESYYDGTFSYFFYADGQNADGLVASYPIGVGATIYNTFELEVYKDGEALSFNDIFIFESIDNKNNMYYVGSFAGNTGLTHICSKTSASTSSTSSTTSSSTSSTLVTTSSTSSTSSNSSTSSTSSNSSTSTTLATSSSTELTSSSNASITSSISENISSSIVQYSIITSYWPSSAFSTTTEESVLPDGSTTSFEVVFAPKKYSSNENITEDHTEASGLSTVYAVESLETTEILTVTSCSEHKCSVVTLTTTYCPLTAIPGSQSVAVVESIELSNPNNSFVAISTMSPNVAINENNGFQVNKSVPYVLALAISFLLLNLI